MLNLSVFGFSSLWFLFVFLIECFFMGLKTSLTLWEGKRSLRVKGLVGLSMQLRALEYGLHCIHNPPYLAWGDKGSMVERGSLRSMGSKKAKFDDICEFIEKRRMILKAPKGHGNFLLKVLLIMVSLLLISPPSPYVHGSICESF